MSEKTIRIVQHWYNDSGDAEIVLVEPINLNRELQNNLFWFSGIERPMLPVETELTDQEFIKHRCYKQRTFTSVEQDIPDDCYIPL